MIPTAETVGAWNDRLFGPFLAVACLLGVVQWALDPSWLRFAVWIGLQVFVVACSFYVSVLVEMAIDDRDAKARRDVTA